MQYYHDSDAGKLSHPEIVGLDSYTEFDIGCWTNKIQIVNKLSNKSTLHCALSI